MGGGEGLFLLFGLIFSRSRESLLDNTGPHPLSNPSLKYSRITQKVSPDSHAMLKKGGHDMDLSRVARGKRLRH